MLFRSGDKQHLWTPLSVCQYMVDAVCFSEGDTTHFLAGICPEWIENGEAFAVEGLRTKFGKIKLSIQKEAEGYRFSLETERAMDGKTILHIPSSEGDKALVLDAEGKTKIDICA